MNRTPGEVMEELRNKAAAARAEGGSTKPAEHAEDCGHGRREGEEQPIPVTFHRGMTMHAAYCPNCGALGPHGSPTIGQWALPRLYR